MTPSEKPTIVDRLPADIHFNIFSASLASYDNVDYERFIKFTPPVRLAQVCRYWRTIFHTSPLLWTRIVIHGLRRGVMLKHQLRRDCSVLAEFLARSGGCLLDLRVTSNYDARNIQRYADCDVIFCKHLIPLLRQIVLRCKNITIAGGSALFLGDTTIIEALRTSPSLAKISISNKPECTIFNSEDFISLLDSLQIHNALPLVEALGSRGASQLRHVEVQHSISWIGFLEIAHGFINLESLSLHVDVDQREASEQMEAIGVLSACTFLALHIFNLVVTDRIRLPSSWSFLDYIRMPALTGLSISVARPIPIRLEATTHKLSSFLMRSPCLEALKFVGHQGYSLTKALPSLTRLERLQIHVQDEPDYQIEELSRTMCCTAPFSIDLEPHSHPLYCPRLESFSVFAPSAEPDTLAKFIQSRVFGTADAVGKCRERTLRYNTTKVPSRSGATAESQAQVVPESLRMVQLLGAREGRFVKHPEILKFCKAGFRLHINEWVVIFRVGDDAADTIAFLRVVS